MARNALRISTRDPPLFRLLRTNVFVQDRMHPRRTTPTRCYVQLPAANASKSRSPRSTRLGTKAQVEPYAICVGLRAFRDPCACTPGCGSPWNGRSTSAVAPGPTRSAFADGMSPIV